MRLHENRSARFKVSHLRYASLIRTQYQLTVKVHRVFPSYCGQAASSPPLQFRRDPLRDSRSVVTRFFVKQSLNAIYCGLTTQHRCCIFRHPFSRSYGANVPSSLERFLSRALVYSTHPPVSVYGTGTLLYPPAFLDRSFSDALWPKPGLRLSMT